MNIERDFTTRVLKDDVLWVKAGTHLDNSNAPSLLGLLADASTKGIRFIIIDLGQVQLLSSAGVGAILGSVETLRQSGGDIVLCEVSEAARRVLEVLDLLDYLTVVASQDEAVARCGT